jgi:glycosyltransferase involved in cell wall biosynthesis
MSNRQDEEPVLSFAVPVRNGARHLPRLLASLSSQDFSRVEILVSDNHSTDRTPSIVREASARDPRIRGFRSATNLGQIANFNLVADLCRGRYVRWIGADDWLEPTYARRCVEALDSSPRAVGVTTFQDHIEEDGTRHYVEYRGPRPDSTDPAERYRRMLWFFTADYRFIDPIYSTLRRSLLMKTRRLLIVPSLDQVLAAELALLGPFVHVPECLAHRGKENTTPDALLKRYEPRRHNELADDRTLTRTVPAMWESVQATPMSPAARLTCAWALARFGSSVTRQAVQARLRRRARVALERVAPPSLARAARSRARGTPT